MCFLSRTAVLNKAAGSDFKDVDRYNYRSCEVKRYLGLGRFFKFLRIWYVLFCLFLSLPLHLFLNYPIALVLSPVLLALAYSLFCYYRPLLPSRNKYYPLLLCCIDFFFITGLVHLTGGIQSIFQVAYSLPVLACTLRFGLRNGFFSLVLSGLLVGSSFLAPLPDHPVPSLLYITTGLGTLAFVIWAVNFVVREELRLRKELYTTSVTDPLTGLYHRGYMRERVHEEIRRCRREGRGFAVVFLDLDLFKKVNDRFGHMTGDTVLRHIAGVLEKSVRGGETLARYGGDEFLLLMPNAGRLQAVQALQRLRKAVESFPCFLDNGFPVKLGISGGTAEYPAHGQTLEQLLQAADREMYRQKC